MKERSLKTLYTQASGPTVSCWFLHSSLRDSSAAAATTIPTPVHWAHSHLVRTTNSRSTTTRLQIFQWAHRSLQRIPLHTMLHRLHGSQTLHLQTMCVST